MPVKQGKYTLYDQNQKSIKIVSCFLKRNVIPATGTGDLFGVHRKHQLWWALSPVSSISITVPTTTINALLTLPFCEYYVIVLL